MSSVSSSTSSTNMMRITGMATGMDTDAMVKAMTANYQTKIDKAGQDAQIIEWKQEAYRDIIKDIKGLQDYFDPLSSKYIMSDSKFNPIKVTNSNESAVGFTAASTAQPGNYKVDVTQLAKPAVLQGNSISATSSTKLVDLGLNEGSIKFKLTINGAATPAEVDIDVSGKTIQDVLNAINNDTNIKTQGVTASFDELSKKFVFSTNKSGDSAKLSLDIESSATAPAIAPDITKLGLSSSVALKSGQNAIFTLKYPDGREETISNQTSNQFTANGINYNLKSIGTADITVAKNDVDSVVNNFKSFITDYNNIIGKIQGKLTEKKQFSYKPLTDEQKESMSDDDIKKWETKAKQGILKNDDYLENLLTNLRTVIGDGVYSSVAGVGTTGHREGSNIVDGARIDLSFGIYGDSALGLDTSKELSDAGKIIIKDENILRDAISRDPKAFAEFFTKKSTTSLGTNAAGQENEYISSKTYFEDGLFARIDKIARNYVGDPGIGKEGTSTVKGLLNIFANKQYDYSMTGTASKNTMPDQIYAKALRIDKLQDQMNDAQSRYYTRFAALETAMNTMNSQLSNFKSQMGIS